MKKFFVVSVLTFFSVYANAAGDKSTNIWFSPLSLAVGITDIGVDFKMGPKSTLGAEVVLWNFGASATGTSVGISGTGFGANYKYYFSGAIQSSFRFIVGGTYFPARVVNGTYSGNINAISGSALIGYHWVPGMINFGFDVGVGYYSSASTIVLTNPGGGTQSFTYPFSGVGPALSFTMGFAF